MNFVNLELKLEFLDTIDVLSNENQDVYTWAEHIKNFQWFCKIESNEEMYTFCTLKVNGTGLKKMKELKRIHMLLNL